MAWRWKADFFPWTSSATVAATLDAGDVTGNLPAEIKAVDDGVIRAELGMAAADMDEQLGAAKALLDRIIVPVAGTSSGSPTGTEVFEYGSVRMTSTVDDDGNRTAVEWSAVE